MSAPLTPIDVERTIHDRLADPEFAREYAKAQDEEIAARDNRIAALTEEIELLRARAPRAYILTRKAEWLRLFREVRGYLRTCRKEKHGTDFAGRQHAMNALDEAIRDLEAASPVQTVICDTTNTPRRHNPLCTCPTYEGNLGPCTEPFELGGNGRCAYCDHTRECHE